jgi:Tat protein translocase TatB subunit
VLLDEDDDPEGGRHLRVSARFASTSRKPLLVSIDAMQGGEIIIILLIALVVFGPKRLPELARKLGRWTAELRAAAADVRRSLEAEVDDLRKVGDDIKAPIDEVKKPLGEMRSEFEDLARGGHEWTGPKPISGPTPADAMRDLEEIERAARAEAAREEMVPEAPGDEGNVAEDGS